VIGARGRFTVREDGSSRDVTARTARRIGKYAGWTEADWRYDEQEARRELAVLEARYRQGDAS